MKLISKLILTSCICLSLLVVLVLSPIEGFAQNGSIHEGELKRFARNSSQPSSIRSDDYEFEKIGGVPYRTGEGYRLTLDVYVPEGDGPFPAILAVHGGSWRSGTKLNWFRHARRLARAGFVVVAINYRHAPRFKFPAQIHDCKAAVRWMRVNAAQYKIDPKKIGGAGYSAGGHLVALLGTTDANDGLEGEATEEAKGVSTRLQAVAPGGAPCEFSWVGDNSDSLGFWLGSTRSSNPEIYRMATPISFITADDPPFYFYQGTDDWVVPKDSPRKMHEALQAAGLDSTFESYEDYGHFALFSHVEAMDPLIEFFNRTLRPNYQGKPTAKGNVETSRKQGPEQ